MLTNYLTIAWRNLWKHKLFSFINVFGLALSMGVCIVVALQVKEDLGYDKFHPNAGRIYRVLTEVHETTTGREPRLASTPLPLAGELSGNPDVAESVARLYPVLQGKAHNGDRELTINGCFADEGFFRVFGFSLAEGNKATALALPNGIVLTREMAAKFFGKADPIGKVISFEKLGNYVVTGVLETAPGRSHIEFDAFASSFAVAQLERSGALPKRENNWNSLNDAYTYVLLDKGIGRQQLSRLLQQLANKPALRSGEGTVAFTPQPLSDITPGSDGIYNEIGHGTVWAKLLTIVGIGLVILVAACFNYTNLTVARALTRAREVGIRKVNGATRGQVFFQYIVEAILIALLALLLGCILLLQFKPHFPLHAPLLVSAVIATVMIGVLAGAFPAWILSSFKPVHVLKNLATTKLFGNLSLHKGLMIFQFSLSLLVLVFLTAYYRQFSFLQTVDPGFNSKNILTVTIPPSPGIFKAAVGKTAGVGNMAATSEVFGMRGGGSVLLSRGKPVAGQGIATGYYFADDGVLPLHGLQLVAGSNFPAHSRYETERYIVANESAVRVLGFKSAADAVGSSLWINDSTQVEILGVIKDFYDKGAARYISPMVLRNRSDAFNYLNIGVAAGARQKVLLALATDWRNLYPNIPFEYQWLDRKIADREDQGDMYAALGFLAAITITIASLGLLGLVVYTVETRRKEVSIRKIIGASASQLMLLLSRQFIRLLVIAGMIALPLGYLASFVFLQNFANRVSFGAGSLLVCFLFLMCIGLFTILTNTYRVAVENPARRLRIE